MAPFTRALGRLSQRAERKCGGLVSDGSSGGGGYIPPPPVTLRAVGWVAVERLGTGHRKLPELAGQEFETREELEAAFEKVLQSKPEEERNALAGRGAA